MMRSNPVSLRIFKNAEEHLGHIYELSIRRQVTGVYALQGRYCSIVPLYDEYRQVFSVLL
jgi:hypothetical protein